MQPREMTLADEFKELSRQHFDQAYAAAVEEGRSDAEVWQLFYASIFDLTTHLTPDLLSAEDYTRAMRAWGSIVHILTTARVVSDDKMKELSAEMLRFYKEMDHAKATINFQLAAMDAMARYALSNSEDSYRDVSEWIEFANTAEKICSKIKESILAPDEPRMSDNDWNYLAVCNHMIGVVNLNLGDYDKGLKYCLSAIHVKGISANDYLDLLQIGEIYHKLAKAFEFDPVYSQIFGFAADLFQGRIPVTFQFQDFQKMIIAAQRQYDPEGKLNDVLLQIMRLIDGKQDLLMANEGTLSSSSLFVKQMRDPYFQKRYEDIYEQLSRVEEKQTEALHEPLRHAESELAEAAKRAERVLDHDYTLTSSDEADLEETSSERSSLENSSSNFGLFRRSSSETDLNSGSFREIPVAFRN